MDGVENRQPHARYHMCIHETKQTNTRETRSFSISDSIRHREPSLSWLSTVNLWHYIRRHRPSKLTLILLLVRCLRKQRNVANERKMFQTNTLCSGTGTFLTISWSQHVLPPCRSSTWGQLILSSSLAVSFRGFAGPLYGQYWILAPRLQMPYHMHWPSLSALVAGICVKRRSL